MKKLLLAGNIVLFVLLLMSYRSAGDRSDRPAGDPDIKLGINPQLSRQMLIEYRDDIWESRKVKGESRKDSRSVWFSLDKLKAFIAEIESKVGPVPNECVKEKGLGIRFYFAVYPDSALVKQKGWDSYFTEHGLPSTYYKLHTLVMVPTVYNETDGFNYDFDPRFRATASNCSFTSIKDVMNILQTTGVRQTNGKPLPGFSHSDVVPDNKTFMLMCDNRDTRLYKNGPRTNAIQNRILNAANTNTNNGATVADDESLNTNGGTLAPPPYDKQGPDGQTVQRQMQTSKPFLTRKIHIPSSGASYMRWVDDTNDTGWVTPPVRVLEASPVNKKMKALMPE